MITERDVIVFTAGAIAARVIPDYIARYIDKVNEKRSQEMAKYLINGLKEAGLLDQPKINEQKIYKTIEELSSRLDKIEEKIGYKK